MNFGLVTAAREEIREAAKWYEARRKGLGTEFVDEVNEAMIRICRKPESSTLLGESVHICRISRFPYGIVYRVENQLVQVYAVTHLHRQPGYWQSRLNPPPSEEPQS